MGLTVIAIYMYNPATKQNEVTSPTLQSYLVILQLLLGVYWKHAHFTIKQLNITLCISSKHPKLKVSGLSARDHYYIARAYKAPQYTAKWYLKHMYLAFSLTRDSHSSSGRHL